MSPAKLLNDHELRTRDVESINSKEQLISFFGYLGYNVDNVGDVTRAAYNLEGDDIKHRITQVTQIGVDPSGENEYRILLLNVRSVTSALIQTIAQRLRDYPGYYLVILTTNYDWLDFVLMERQVSKSGTVLRPRTLTVNRRNPGIIALRVLKRFTVTESEGTYQWDKLRSAYTLAEWSEPEFNNRALFSDYYL